MDKTPINSVLNEQINSFDNLLTGNKSDLRLYGSAVIGTKDAWSTFDCCLLLNITEEGNEGVFLKNDAVITNPNQNWTLDSLDNRQLILQSTNRFFSVYLEQEGQYSLNIEYIFYSKSSVEGLLSFLGEIYYKNMIDPSIVVGAVTLYNKNILNNKEEAMTVLLTTMPLTSMYDYETGTLSNLYIEQLCNDGVDNSFTQNLRTRVMTMSLVNNLLKNRQKEKMFVFEDKSYAALLEEYIKDNYNLFSEEEKDICVLIQPDVYNYTNPQFFGKVVADAFIISMFNLVREMGSNGLAYLEQSNQRQIKLIENTRDRLLNNPKFVFTETPTKSFLYAIVIYSINKMYQNSSNIAPITAYWSYYSLCRLRRTCSKDLLPFFNTILSYVLWTNINHFKELFSELKNTTLVINTSEMPKMSSSWKSINEQTCVYELIYHFYKGENENLLTEEEGYILGHPDRIGFSFNSICDYLGRTVKHTFLGITIEREFYSDLLYSYIETNIENNNPYFNKASI